MVKYSQEKVRRAVLRTAKAAFETSLEYCPVRTGRLKNSITLLPAKESAVILTDVEYAANVELGTFRQRPQPFLSRGIYRAAERAGEIFKEELL